jgi:hypothetical protein
VKTTDPITRVRGGDGDAFRELTEPHRRVLQVRCSVSAILVLATIVWFSSSVLTLPIGTTGEVGVLTPAASFSTPHSARGNAGLRRQGLQELWRLPHSCGLLEGKAKRNQFRLAEGETHKRYVDR